jgi:uncharacterized protein involved in exopolysaccharide biosynthesis/Mrp family chromosome partitioning ATPase
MDNKFLDSKALQPQTPGLPRGGALKENHSGEPEKPLDFNIKEILAVLFKHKFKILSILLAGMAGAYCLFDTIPPRYEANATMIVRYGWEYAMGNEDQNPVKYGLPEIIASEMAIISSKDLIEKVIDRLGPENIYPTLAAGSNRLLESLTFNFSRDLEVTAPERSNIIKVAFKSNDPNTASNAVNCLVDIYMQKRMNILNDSASVQFLEQALSERRAQLIKSEDRLESLKRQYDIVSFEEERKRLLEQRTSIEAWINSTSTAIKELRQKQHSLEAELTPIPEAVDSWEVDALGKDLAELRRKEREYSVKYSDSSPLLTTIRRQMKSLMEEYNAKKGNQGGRLSEGDRVSRKDIIMTRVELGAMEVRSKDLSAQMEALNNRLRTLDLQEKSFRDLEREVSTNEQNCQVYAKKLELARLASDNDNMHMTSISVLEKAIPPIVPISKHKRGRMFFIAAGAFLGLFGGVGLAFCLEHWGQGVLSPVYAEKYLGLPNLVSIPLKRAQSILPASFPEIQQEMFTLYQAIDSQVPSGRSRVIQFLGSKRGEGTSTVARELARIAAHKIGLSVLLLDANRIAPSLDAFFSLQPKEGGWQDGVRTAEEVELTLHQVGNTTLYLSPSSNSARPSPVIFNRRRIRSVWDDLRRRFDLIIVDSAPITVSPDSAAIANEADGTILVVEAENTRWTIVDHARQKVAQSGGIVLGTVLNKRKFHIPNFIYKRI